MKSARTRRILCIAFGAAVLPGCALKYTSAALGDYATYEVFGRPRGVSMEVELAQPAYVAIVSVTTPGPSYTERPVLFSAVYPLYETDPKHFSAGTHRLFSRQTSLRQPLNCADSQKPTLEGCRRSVFRYPGVDATGPNVYPPSTPHYIIVASEEYIDPFTLADELVFLAFENPDLTRALLRRDATVAGPELERVLLDMPGSRWAAVYVASR